jgi:hypothetical protein
MLTVPGVISSKERGAIRPVTPLPTYPSWTKRWTRVAHASPSLKGAVQVTKRQKNRCCGGAAFAASCQLRGPIPRVPCPERDGTHAGSAALARFALVGITHGTRWDARASVARRERILRQLVEPPSRT